jgi:hypothetical protein
MNPTDLNDDTLAGLLRAAAPPALPDDGFVARTLAAVDQAARGAEVRRRPTPLAPIAVARALAAEERRHAAQARMWRWIIAGIAAGFLLMIVAMLLSPADGTLAASRTLQLFTMFGLTAVGALCVAWQELRSN